MSSCQDVCRRIDTESLREACGWMVVEDGGAAEQIAATVQGDFAKKVSTNEASLVALCRHACRRLFHQRTCSCAHALFAFTLCFISINVKPDAYSLQDPWEPMWACQGPIIALCGPVVAPKDLSKICEVSKNAFYFASLSSGSHQVRSMPAGVVWKGQWNGLRQPCRPASPLNLP